MFKSDFKEPDFKKELTSDFNEAKYQIYRLHLDLLDCRSYAKKGNLINWKWVLDHIWLELAADARTKDSKDLEKNKYFKRIEELNKEIAKNENDRDKLYKALQEKEMFLRFLQDDVGKGSKRSSTDEEDFD